MLSSGGVLQVAYKCYKPSDSRYFTQTSDEPYDRHHYKLTLKSGKSIVIDDYEVLRSMWFQYNAYADKVEVLDARCDNSEKE